MPDPWNPVQRVVPANKPWWNGTGMADEVMHEELTQRALRNAASLPGSIAGAAGDAGIFGIVLLIIALALLLIIFAIKIVLWVLAGIWALGAWVIRKVTRHKQTP